MVGTEALARGFEMLGIETFNAVSAKEAYDYVLQLINRKDVGVVLITEDYYMPFREKYFAMKISMERPILLEIPTVQNVDLGTETIANFVKRATGVTV